MLMRYSFALFALVVLGCGGSSSETPWPAEPEGKLLGPAGETERPEDLNTTAPDAGSEPNVEP